jgi:hypothetical protein
MEFWTSAAPYAPFAVLVGLVAWATRSMLGGSIVSRTQLTDLRADRDAQLKDKNEQVTTWRDSYLAAEASRSLQAGQIEKLIGQVGILLDQGKTAEHLLREIQSIAEEQRRVR